MRIITRLKITSAVTIAAIIALAPLLIWSLAEFSDAKTDYILADAIQDNFFERASFRDQYFLYREDRLRAQWDKNKETADGLLRQANVLVHNEEDRESLDHLRKNIKDTAIIFHRIVKNTEAMKIASGNRPVYEELDKRLYSQLLLKATAVRDRISSLEKASSRRVEQTYQRLIIITALFAVTLALATILTSIQITGLIRKRLAPLHAGAKIVADGGLDHRINSNGSDEFAELAASINAMTDTLAEEITEHRKSEEALRQSEDKYRKLVENSPDIIYAFSDKRGGIFYSGATEAVLGYSSEYLLQHPYLWAQSIHPEDTALVENAVASFEQGVHFDIECRIKAFDGSWKWLRDRSIGRRAIGDEIIIEGVASNITERKKMEDALRKSEARWQFALEGAGDGLWDWNAVTNEVYFSPRWKEMLGHTEDEIGSSLDEWDKRVHPDDKAQCYADLDKHFRGETPVYQNEHRVLCKDGSYKWILDRGKVIEWQADGKPARVIGAHSDITDRKLAEEEIRNRDKRYHTLIQSIEAAVVVHDSDTQIITINTKALELLGLTQDQALGKTAFDPGWMFIEVNETPMPFSRYPSNQVVSSGKAVRDFVVGIKRPVIGDIVWVIVNAIPIFDGQQIKEIIVSFMDITSQKKAEAGLLIAKEQAEAATKLKDQFVSLVAHDLRSPFTSMMGLLRLFMDRKLLDMKEEEQKLLDAVFQSGDRMLKMIDDLLKISRLQTGQITPQPRFFKGHTAVAVTIGSISHIAAQKGVVIINDIPVDTRLYADQSLFDEVLLNLLTNAIKFCSKGDRITFFIPPGLKSAIAVRDTGKGVDERIIPNLFKHEVKTTTVGTGGERGTGLGLPYSYDIIKAHGGEITVESAPGKGTVFCVMLPYVRPIALVVDDEPMALLIVRSHLEKIDIEVREALSGEQALAVIKDTRPHIIITDINMPGMDGFALLDRLKKESATRDIPVIVMTSTDGAARETALRHGAADFVSKPIMVEDFILRVRRFVG